MRVLRLIRNDDFALELHPYVSVLTGLSEGQREQVLAAFRDAAAGRVPALGGLIEAHGVVLDLDGQSLSLLELDDVEVDVVVTTNDLPGAATGGVGRQLRAAERRLADLDEPQLAARRRVEEAERAADEAHRALQEARAAAEHDGGDEAAVTAELEALEAELRQAERTVESLAEPASRAAGALQQAERAVEQAEQRRDALAAIDPEDLRARRIELGLRREALVEATDDRAGNALDNALAELADAQQALAEAEAAGAARLAAAGTPRPRAGDDGDGGDAEDEEEQEEAGEDGDEDAELERRIEEIRGILALHESFDPEPVHAALDAIRLTPAAGALVPSPEAIGLAHRIEELSRQVQVQQVDASAVPLPGEIDAATAQLDELRSRVVELERSEIGPSGPEADIAELERAHAEVAEAREALGGRFGRGKAQARLDEAIEAERAVLDRLGFGSYTDFMTGGRAALARPAESDDLRAARAAAREAELALRDMLAAVDRDLAHTEVIEDLKGVQRQARELLGDDTLEGQPLINALLDLRVPSEDTSPVQELRAALGTVGLDLAGLDLTAEDVTAMAADWLDEYHRAEDRRAALVAELAELQARLAGEDIAAAADDGEVSTAFALGAFAGSDGGAADLGHPDTHDAPVAQPPAADEAEAAGGAGASDDPASEPAGWALPFASDSPGETVGFALPFASDDDDAGEPAGFGLPFASDDDDGDDDDDDDVGESEDAASDDGSEEAAADATEPDPEPDPEPAAEPVGALDPADAEEVEATRAVIADAEARVAAAKARVIAHESAARELAEIDAELAALAEQMAGVDEVADLVDDAVRAVDVATADYEDIEQQRAAAENEIVRLRSEIESRRQVAGAGPSHAERVAAAETSAAQADEALRAAREELDRARDEYDAVAVEVSALRQTVADLQEQPAPVEEIEWYLLARLAGQRHVSFAGSVPLVVDGALDAIDAGGKQHLLDRLERMAGAVQVVHVSDDPGVLEWARAAGEDRVAVVSPVTPHAPLATER